MTPLPVTALIADVSGNRVILNRGARAGIQVGDQLSVQRALRAITDPATGREIGRAFTEVGTLRVAAVDDLSSTAEVLSGSDLRIGDRAVTTATARRAIENVLGR